MLQPPDESLHWQPGFPIDARQTLAALRRGHHDPTHRITPDRALWRTALTSTGPVTYRIRQQRLDDLSIDAWGPGARELVDTIPIELGAGDHPELFRPNHPFLQRALRRMPGLRVPCTGRLFEALVPAIIEQRVVGLDAEAAFTRSCGRTAPNRPAPPRRACACHRPRRRGRWSPVGAGARPASTCTALAP